MKKLGTDEFVQDVLDGRACVGLDASMVQIETLPGALCCTLLSW
jgi:hypothetical protein